MEKIKRFNFWTSEMCEEDCDPYESETGEYVLSIHYDQLLCRNTELEAEIKNWKGKYESLLEDFRRLKPIYDYVDGMAVSVAEDEIDRLRESLLVAKEG